MAKFEQIERNTGVDSLQPGTEWIMVPKGKSNLICLTGGAKHRVEAVEGKTYVRIDVIHEDKYADEVGRINALFIGKNDKLLRITGLHRGPGRIVASNGSDKAELKFSVHGPRTFNVSFFFLYDLDGQNRPMPRSAYGPNDAVGWVEMLNTVYGQQANIWFAVDKNMPLAVSGLPGIVSSDNAQMLANHKDAQVATGKTKESKAPIRVFLAGPTIRSIDNSHPNGFYHVATKVIIMKDQKDPNFWENGDGRKHLMVKTLAHEIGHFLNYLQGAGQGHDFFLKTGYVSDILNTMDGQNIKISRQRVLDWNPT